MDILELRVVEIAPAANNALLLTLEEIHSSTIKYEAGQFITILLQINGREVRRSYSIVTSPGESNYLALVIKRQENGEVSRYLADHLQPGDILKTLHPSGRFTLQTDSSKRRTLFFIAAGSGISPIFPLLKKLLRDEPLSRAILIYQNRSDNDTIFRKELVILSGQFSERFTWINLLSRPGHAGERSRRLNNTLLEELIRRETGDIMPASLFYVCGPGSFMRMVQFVLKLMGCRDEQIRKENFVIIDAPAPPAIMDRSPKTVTLKWKGEQTHFTVAYPVNILQGAWNNGFHLPFSCRAGRCSTCVAHCSAGKVKMTVNEVLTDRELQEGLILTCVAYAETDLVIEVG